MKQPLFPNLKLLLPLVIFALTASTPGPDAMAQAENPYETEVRRRMLADDGLPMEERKIWAQALEEGFKGAFEGLPWDEASVLDRVDTIFHIVIEGIFADLGPTDVVPVARTAFDARRLGAPALAAEGISLYGLSEYVREKGIRLDPRQVAAWARGVDSAQRLGIPDYIAQDFVAEAISSNWSIRDYEKLNGALLEAVHRGYKPEIAGRYLLIAVERGEKTIDQIVTEMVPYLEKIRKEEAERQRKEGTSQPTEVTYDPWAGMRERPSPSGGGSQGAPPRKPEPLLSFVPAPGRQQPKRQPPPPPPPPSRPAPVATAPSAPPSDYEREQSQPGRLVYAQPEQVLGQMPRQAFIDEMASWIGTPYQWGGTRKILGTDCSGFTQGS
ncbi:MAG: hypothetical protein AB1405_06340, partial [Bdellovibrionota bacterium]